MNKTIVLGIKNSGVNNIYQLPPRLNIDGTDVVIHYNPMVQVVGGSFSCNCDIALDFTNPYESGDGFLQAALGDNYYPIARLPKSLQHVKLLAARSDTKNGSLQELKLPVLLTGSFSDHGGANTMSTIDKIGSSLASAPYSEFQRIDSKIEKVVVKPENGARGRGQAVVPIDQLRMFFNDLDLPLSKLKEKYPDVTFTEADPNAQGEEEDPKLANIGDWTVSEYVDNIKEEYRIVVSGNSFRIATRQRSQGVYPQANLDLDKLPKTREFEKLDPSFELGSIVASIVETFNLRLGSIDLFKTQNEEYGFFECCPQFGLNSMLHDEAFQIHYDFVDWLVNNYQTNTDKTQ